MLNPRDLLLENHDEFRRLIHEHTLHSQRLEALAEKRFPTEDEQVEESRLKKLKLRLKDQIDHMEREIQGVGQPAQA